MPTKAKTPLTRNVIVLTTIAVLFSFFFNRASASIKGSSDTIAISFVGDILLASTVGQLIDREGPDAPWVGVAEALRAADLTVGNLETAVATSGTPIEGKTYTFRAKPEALEGLKNAGIDVVSLANNHTMDFGVEGLLETIDHLRSYGIEPIGAGPNELSARTPYIFEKDGIRVGILATSMVIPTVDWRTQGDRPGMAADYPSLWPRLKASIDKLKPQVDHIAVFLHWGEERKEIPENYVLETQQRLKDAGVSMIIGSHPHVLRGICFDGETITAHSLGNFVFTTRPDFPTCQEGGILTVTLSKESIESAKLSPTKIVWGKTYLMEGVEQERTLSRIASLSKPFATCIDDETGEIFHIYFGDMFDHWAKQTVMQMYRLGIIEGYPDGTFRPEETLSKGQFAALLSRAISKDEDITMLSQNQDFALCEDTHWAFPHLNFLVSCGILEPYQEGFDPDSPCSRKTAAIWLWKAITESTDEENEFELPFFDAPPSDDPAFAAICWCVSKRIFEGYEDNTLRLQETLTRAQSAILMWRFLQYLD
jgi:poly-gamma-glutamate capsule biosynthesis protein CapA/YwtB (metallophosphatase superfamily)